jgi:protein-disulfide isomerase
VRARLFPALLLAVAVLLGPTLRAQTADGAFTPAQRAQIVAIVRDALKADPSILRDAVTALQEDDARAQDAAARVAIGKAGPALSHSAGDPVAGNPYGDVTLVEFYDLHCPYCRAMLPVLQSLLASDPKLRVIYKDIPVLGPGSVLGARAVLAAQNQGGYLKLQGVIMTGPGQITEDSLHMAADKAGLDWPRLRHDMDDPAIQARIDANLALAQSLGVQGTPVFVAGGRMLPGAVPLAQLQAAVAAARGRG